MDTHLTTQGKFRLFGRHSNARLTFWLGIILGFLIALMAISAYIGYLYTGGKFFIEQPDLIVNNANNSLIAQPVTDINKNSADIVITDNDNIFGNKDAELTLLVYGDFECELCKMYHRNVTQFVSDNNTKIRLIEKNFVLSQKHPQALSAAKAAYCAGQQEKYYEAADNLYENQDSLSEDYGSILASSLSLNIEDYNNCLSEDGATEEIENDYSEGLNLGVQGIPNTVIIYPDGSMKLIDGNVSVEFLTSLLKEYL